MAAYLLRRIFQLLIVIWGAATLLFLAFFMLSGNPAERFASGGGSRNPPPSVVQNLEHKFGLDKPKLNRYVDYMKGLPKGDLGTSYRSGTSVWKIAKATAPTSLRLAFWAIIIEGILGIAGGMLSAGRRNSIGDVFTTITAVVASAIPVFVLGYLIKQLTGVYANDHNWPAWARFPTETLGENKWILGVIPTANTWKYVVQPAFVLASVTTAILARITRTSMLETMRQDYVRTARSKGLGEGRVMRKHVLRNAMIPVVTILGMDFGIMVGAAILTETVFNINGMGSTIVRGAVDRDAPLVIGLTMIVTFIFGLSALLVDLSYAWLNPRVRLGDE